MFHRAVKVGKYSIIIPQSYEIIYNYHCVMHVLLTYICIYIYIQINVYFYKTLRLLTFCLFVYFGLFWYRISLGSPGWPWMHNLPALGYRVLRLQMGVTTPGQRNIWYHLTPIHDKSTQQTRNRRKCPPPGKVYSQANSSHHQTSGTTVVLPSRFWKKWGHSFSPLNQHCAVVSFAIMQGK